MTMSSFLENLSFRVDKENSENAFLHVLFLQNDFQLKIISNQNIKVACFEVACPKFPSGEISRASFEHKCEMVVRH